MKWRFTSHGRGVMRYDSAEACRVGRTAVPPIAKTVYFLRRKSCTRFRLNFSIFYFVKWKPQMRKTIRVYLFGKNINEPLVQFWLACVQIKLREIVILKTGENLCCQSKTQDENSPFSQLKHFWMSTECSRNVHWNPDFRQCSVTFQWTFGPTECGGMTGAFQWPFSN